MASFSVVAMVREELDVIRRFLDYWSAIGADRIHLFYDGEIPLDTFEDYPNVTLRLTDEALWQDIGGKRSDVVAARQQAIFNYLYPAIKSDWLIFPDCDEFVAGTASVLEFLDSVPSEVLSVGLPTAEAVFRREDDEDLAFLPVTHLAHLLRHQGRGAWRKTAGREGNGNGVRSGRACRPDVAVSLRRDFISKLEEEMAAAHREGRASTKLASRQTAAMAFVQGCHRGRGSGCERCLSPFLSAKLVAIRTGAPGGHCISNGTFRGRRPYRARGKDVAGPRVAYSCAPGEMNSNQKISNQGRPK